MTLSELYIRYLQKRDAPAARALAQALEPSQPMTARFLAAYALQGAHEGIVGDGPWQGARAWVGPQLPAAPSAGQIWFDTCEVGAMVLIPSEPPQADWAPELVARWTPFLGWMSLRPVAVWQFQAYLDIPSKRWAKRSAKTAAASRTGHVPYDRARIQQLGGGGDQTGPVTGMTAVEAKAFANWMGKWLPHQHEWQETRRLRPDAVDVLWNGLKKEWVGYPEPDDDEATAISPATIDADLGDEHDAGEPPPPERRALYRYNDWSRSFGFRTFVHSQGLVDKKVDPHAYKRSAGSRRKLLATIIKEIKP